MPRKERTMSKSDVVKDFSDWKVNRVFGDKPLDVTKDCYFQRFLRRAVQEVLIDRVEMKQPEAGQ